MRAITTTVGKMHTPSDARLLTAFEISRLDHNNPLHWWVLLVAFCEHHFAESKSKPTTWDDEELAKMLRYMRIVDEKHPGLRDANLSEFAREVKALDEKYKSRTTHYIATRIREAEDPARNLALRYPDLSDPELRKLRADSEKMGIEWTPEIEKKNIDMLASFRNAIDQVKEQLGIGPPNS